MIHHVSIPARDPQHVAEVLAELMGGKSYVITHPGMDIGWVSSAVRMARMTAVWLAFAVLTTERNAA